MPSSLDTQFQTIDNYHFRYQPSGKRKLNVKFIDDFMELSSTHSNIMQPVSAEITLCTVDDDFLIVAIRLKIHLVDKIINSFVHEILHAFELNFLFHFHFLVIFKVIEIYYKFYTIKTFCVIILCITFRFNLLFFRCQKRWRYVLFLIFGSFVSNAKFQGL